MVNKKFWATAFTLTGTIIGAGILGLPYVFAKSGFLVGVFWLIFLGAVMLIANLYLAEVTLRTKERYQLTGYAKRYLGKFGGKLMFFAMIFGIYSALLAYLIGEAQSLAQIFHLPIHPVVYGLLFWLTMTFLLAGGLKGLKKIETWGVLAIIGIIIGMLIYFFPQINFQNLNSINLSNFFLPIGVVMFALLGFTSIPELRKEILGQERNFKKAIILGTLIPIFLYIIFSAIFVGVLGTNISQVATLSLGIIVTLLGVFTMLTSYFVLAFSIKNMYQFDMGLSKGKTFFWSSLFPLILFLLVTILKVDNFTEVLGIGGVISGGLTGILILLMNYKAKKQVKKKPQFEIPINWPIIILLSIVFVLGVLAELVF